MTLIPLNPQFGLVKKITNQKFGFGGINVIKIYMFYDIDTPKSVLLIGSKFGVKQKSFISK
jgi:hypothetical protein